MEDPNTHSDSSYKEESESESNELENLEEEIEYLKLKLEKMNKREKMMFSLIQMTLKIIWNQVPDFGLNPDDLQNLNNTVKLLQNSIE